MALEPGIWGGAVGGAEAVLDGRDRGGRGGGADVVGERVEVAVRGEDPDALDLGAVLGVLEEGRLAGGEGAAGTDGLGADHRRAGHGRREVVRRDRERVRVREVVAECAAEQGEEVAAVDGADDGPPGGEIGVVDAGARRVTAVSRSNSLVPAIVSMLVLMVSTVQQETTER